MDTENTKQIIIAYNAIKDSLAAILKPIRINLNDTETAMKMSKVQKDTLEVVLIDCRAIQRIVEEMEDLIGDLKESIYDDGEVEEARKMISDILFDVQPVPNKIPNQPALDGLADEIFKPNLVVSPTIEEISKAARLK